jgi:hypothetical protein
MKRFQLIRGGASTNEPPGSGDDPFQIVFAPAKPVLFARMEMRKPMMWLDEQRLANRPLFDPKRAAELIDLIPDGDHLTRAGVLFHEAEQIPAPEGWLHVAVGLMLQAQPYPADVDGDAYRGAIADGAFADPEVWGEYEPGFSAAVIVNAIRYARSQYSDLPSPGRFLNLCIKNRAQFKTWNADISTLMQVRWKAEDYLEEAGQPVQLVYDDDNSVPF